MRKEFGPTLALKDVDITLYRGEIRGLIGENGSGKSTVMSIVAGIQRQTSGEMLYKGQHWDPQNMVVSQKAGISMVLQESNTIPGVTVAQNIFAGHESEFTKLGIIQMKKMYRAADQLLTKHGLSHIKASDQIDQYNFEDRKLMEIVRCVNDETEIFIVDETTTALSIEKREMLYSIIHDLAKRGKSVVFISHDIDEILEHCSVVTVLRDGEIVGQLSRDDMASSNATQKIQYMMVGRDIGEKYYREDFDSSHRDEIALEFQHVTFGQAEDFSLELHKGEIVGIAGLSGCGMHEIGRAAYGLEKLKSGKVIRNGNEITTSQQAIRSGIGYISKYRDTEAIILSASVIENIVLPSLSEMSRFTFINPADEKKKANKEIEAFSIKCNSGNQTVNTLSGGNKQKVSFAKWTAKGSEVLIMDCPTRGVDVGVKQAMYALIEEMKKQGKAILLISEELSELMGMADRLIVMRDSMVTCEFSRSKALQQVDVIQYMI